MDRIWWNHIIKAHKFLEDIVTLAAGGNSIIVSLPEKVPWRNTLLELIEEQLKMENPKNSFDMIASPEEEVGLFLLEKYCKKEKRATYRYGMTYASFLGRCEDIVLNDRYLWVTDISKERYEEWLDFIIEYNKNVENKTPAVFILETQDNAFANKARKGIRKLIFDQQIGFYDKFAFCALAATDKNCKEYLRPYLAELAATICSDDIELSAACVNAGNKFLKNPIMTVREIISEQCRSNGERYEFQKSDEEIKKDIWETQLKNVFPEIEKFRSNFTKKYKKMICKALPFSNSCGIIIEEPEDVEIGMLVHLIRNGAFSVDNQEYTELCRFRKARNDLAHLNILEQEVVDIILRRTEVM